LLLLFFVLGCELHYWRSRCVTGEDKVASDFHPLVQRNALRRFDGRQQSRWFVRWNQSLRRSPTPTGFAEIVSDDLPVLHARRILPFCSPHGNDEVIQTGSMAHEISLLESHVL
jgi:hypothetical protein